MFDQTKRQPPKKSAALVFKQEIVQGDRLKTMAFGSAELEFEDPSLLRSSCHAGGAATDRTNGDRRGATK